MTKSPKRYLALLRGINVGGKNVITKEDLRKCFERLGFDNVRTYIQSGNVLFDTHVSDFAQLTEQVQTALSKRFKYDARAVVIPKSKYKSMLRQAPDDWGTEPNQKHNAIFVLPGATPRFVLSKLGPPKAEIETVTTASGVIFWSISKRDQTKATYMKLSSKPVYRSMTIRNHNTVFKLAEMFDE